MSKAGRPWHVELAASARRDLARLPEEAAAAVIETIEALAVSPYRLGKRLHFGFEGRWTARRGPYRVIYRVDDDKRRVSVIAIGHRRDIYRSR